MSEQITCQICQAQTHSIQIHLRDAHPDWTSERYAATYPDAPLLSEFAKQRLAQRRASAAAPAADSVGMAGTAAATVSTIVPKGSPMKKALHEVFELGTVKAAMSTQGKPIPITVMAPHDEATQAMVPDISDSYVYNIDELKNVILGLELKIPTLVWGHKGTGKSELLTQVAARTNRPIIRIQHTVNTEESHIVGQWTVKGGATVFELGPLPIAMREGWIYCADEYDFGMPSVLSVYQAVLEGNPLVIKEAPAELRVIKPHPNFRFVATGNTNGSGDESGLYQGTLIQNSANYDRFGMVVHKQYMDKRAESQILQNHCKLMAADADRMIEFASLVRESYDGAKMSDTVSPRALIYASKIGIMRGSFIQGLNLSFISKLSKVDREVATGLAQRVFGK